MSKVLEQLRTLNRENLKNPDNYLFIGKYLQRRFIVTNLDMGNILLPENYLYNDGVIIVDGISYEVVSREEYNSLD